MTKPTTNERKKHVDCRTFQLKTVTIRFDNKKKMCISDNNYRTIDIKEVVRPQANVDKEKVRDAKKIRVYETCVQNSNIYTE